MPLCQLSRESISVSLRLAAQHRERRAQNRDGRGEEKDEERSAKRGTDEEQEENRFGNGTHLAECSAQSRVESDVRHYFIFSYESLCRLEEFIYLSAHLVTRQARIYENLGHMPEVITHLFGLLAHSTSQN